MPQKTAVICLLSSIPFISTRFDPLFAVVQFEAGTRWRPVWSQFKISEGISSIFTTSITFRKNSSFTSLNTCGGIPHFVVALHLVKFILLRRDFAHEVVRVISPPYSTSRVLSKLCTIPLAPATTIVVFTAPLTRELSTRTFEQTHPTSFLKEHSCLFSSLAIQEHQRLRRLFNTFLLSLVHTPS